MRGIEVAKKIRESEAGKETKAYVIMVTSKSGKEHMLAALEAGVDDFITKPVDSGKLISRIKEAERKFNSTAPKYQEAEGPPIARGILIKLGAKEKLIDEVCDIVSHHHHPKPDDNVNFKVVYDSDMIVNIEENMKENPIDENKIADIIDKSFLTETGRIVAREVLIKK